MVNPLGKTSMAAAQATKTSRKILFTSALLNLSVALPLSLWRMTLTMPVKEERCRMHSQRRHCWSKNILLETTLISFRRMATPDTVLQKFILWCIPNRIHGTRQSHLDYSREKIMKHVTKFFILSYSKNLLTCLFQGAWNKLVASTRISSTTL
jgi:hypothetical protein